MGRGRGFWIGAGLVLAACGNGGREDGSESTVGITIGPGTSGTTEASDETAGMRLDVPATSGMADDGQTTGECVSQSLEPELQLRPVDVLVVVDTSNSMAAAIDAVEASINDDFAAILGASGIPYQVIVAGDYPPGEQLDICITAPLSGTDCNPPPAVPAVTDVYEHYDGITGSGAFLNNIVAWYSAPDPHGLAPTGYSGWLREDSLKVILAMTDGTSASNGTADGDAFDQQLLSLVPPLFGVPGDRQYVFHSIISMAPNMPPTAPWLPGDPLQGSGQSIQQVSVISGGWRFPLSEAGSFDVVFQQIAQGVVDVVPISCSFQIPEPPPGETIDPDTVEIDYQPGGGGPLQSFHQVTGPGACEPDAFYISGGVIFLCPEACTSVQSDSGAALDVRFGCDVGYEPAG
ncbi:hypothetical protein [Paraliomyxa miuraensis]|uniref:hypothetical protein n=1 Tax=Paraliomyxa miuraensis TaxID=376150 RepID=UPI00224E3C4C|nr:hypothetical protein [Paraliomyxa miuraensis]MCX4240607.1 hypothetical protein [Paraliomyxa miuraensis]